MKDLPDTIMLEPESCGSYLTGPGLGPQMLNLSHWDEPALPLLFFLPARSAVTYNHTMYGTLTLFRERRPQPVLAIPVLALTLIAPWVLGQDTDPIAEIRRQADQGNASAQSYLGFMYETGEGVPKNEAKAVKWYRLAADQGDTVAQTNLGLMYADGRGVLEDDREAVKWFRLAADQGVATANSTLASCMPTARACRKTMLRPSSGSGSLPIKGTPMPNPTSASCMPTVRACRKTMPKPPSGIGSLPIRVSPLPNSTSA